MTGPVPNGDRAGHEAGPVPSTALGRLLGSVPLADFADRIWGRDLFVRTAADGPDLCGLFTLADADELLSVRGLRTPFLRIAKDGVVQAESSYTRGGGVGARVRDQVDPDRVAWLIGDGCTVVFQGLHRLWPSVIELTSALTHDLGHAVQVNAYLTPPTARGFAPHYDTHDVFVLQTAGNKRWRVHRPVVDSPAADDEWTGHRDAVSAAAAAEPTLDHLLSPGDVLYLPRGWIHSAEAQDTMSLHLTIGVHPYTRRHLVEALLAEVLDTQPLEASLPMGLDVADAHDLAGPLALVRDLVADGLAAASAPRIAARMERRRADDTRPEPLRPIEQAVVAAQAGQAAEPGTQVAVRSRLGAHLRVEEHLDRVTLVADGRRLDFEPDHAAALKAVVEGGRCLAEQLPGLEPAAGRVMVRRLLLDGAVVPA